MEVGFSLLANNQRQCDAALKMEAHLLVLPPFRHGPVLLRLLEEDLLHLSVLQVIELSHGVLCSCNQVHDHRQRSLAAQKSMLWERKG